MITVTHTAVAVGADDPTKEINAGEWNAAHTLAGTPDSCCLTNSIDISIPASAGTILTFDTEMWDTAAMHAAGDPSKITIKLAGKYLVISRIPLDTTGTNITAENQIMVNGTRLCGTGVVTASGFYTTLVATGLFQFALNDYLQVSMYLTAGPYPVSAVRNIEFSAIWMSA